MSEQLEYMKAVRRRMLEARNESEVHSTGSEFLADEYRWENPNLAVEIEPGPAGRNPLESSFRDAFPDGRYTIEDQIAEGDRVMTRWSFEGTHEGRLPMLGIEPTGRRIKLTGIVIDRFEEGKVVECWDYEDMLSFLQQLGVLPEHVGQENA